MSNRLYNRFDNRLYRVNKHPTGCQTGCQTGLTTVLNEQLFFQPVVKPGCTTGLTRLSNRFDNPFDNSLYRVNGALLTYLLTPCRPHQLAPHLLPACVISHSAKTRHIKRHFQWLLRATLLSCVRVHRRRRTNEGLAAR